MSPIYHRGFAVRFLLEASVLDEDPLDKDRYYSVDATIAEDIVQGVSTVVLQSSGKRSTFRMKTGARAVETKEDVDSRMTASLFFNSNSEVANAIRDRVRHMDHLRVEISDGTGMRVAFDGFLDAESGNKTSSPNSYRTEFTVSACGIMQVLNQSWFNWQGAVQPAEDIFTQGAGTTLYQKLANGMSMEAQDIIKAFLSAGSGIIKVKAGQDPIFPGDFFLFGEGDNFKSAFELAFPYPALVYQNYSGPLWGLIADLADPDIHECFFTYTADAASGREKPTLFFRPRPIPGGPGDDARWKALPVFKIGDGTPAAKMIAEEKRSNPHPNAFHWASADSDVAWDDQASKMVFGFWIDKHGINRYGYSAKAVASRLPPLGSIDKPHKAWTDQIHDIVERVAWQEAVLPNLTTRTMHMALRPGLRAGCILEDHTGTKPVTGYITSIGHRVQADPFMAVTTVGVTRCFQATAEEYPDKVRATVDIVHKNYVEGTTAGSASPAVVQSTQKATPPANCSCATPAASMPNVPYGKAIVDNAKLYGIPPWILAHVLRCESSIGSLAAMNTPGPSGDLGIAQFTPIAVADLYNQGYRNEDGSVFTYPSDLLDPCKSIRACAFYLSFIAGKIKAAGLIADLIAANNRIVNGHVVLYAWTAYGYNRGWPLAQLNGHAQGWLFSNADKVFVQYKNYWGFDAIQGGSNSFGGLS
jgi:hypothetical protein